jgi:hypothetical protein
MPYKLKPNQEPFQCCGGQFEGRKFLHGQTYPEIPPEEAVRFDETEPAIESSSHRVVESGIRRTRRPNDSTDPIDPAPSAPKEV